MGWAEYHRAAFGDPHEALERARGALSAAVGPVAPEITVPDLDGDALEALVARLGPSGPARRVERLLLVDGAAPLDRWAAGAERFEVQGESRTGGPPTWVTRAAPPWPEDPRSAAVAWAGDDALARALACRAPALESRATLDPADLPALLDAGVPAVVAWWCAFDGHGPAYHGVRLALHGRYQDGGLREVTPGRHELVVLVSGKRPDAAALVARISAAAGVPLVRDGSGP